MLTRHYTLRFNTPAFLGNANQSGQWRTPPIKALLRQWWRVAYAAQHPGAVPVNALRAAEGRLFGMASDDDGSASGKSLVRIRLDDWSAGKLKSWDGLEQRKVHHPETERVGYQVGPHAYLGFGPLDGRGNTRFGDKCNAAIQCDSVAGLSLAFPASEHAHSLDHALWLLHHFGTLGGRSRNGWGSFSLLPVDASTPTLDGFLDESLTKQWMDALEIDWPQAIGRDAAGPLIWQTEPLADWKAAMRRLAEIKIGLRTQFVFMSGKNAPLPEARHWLSYPVTNHTVRDWGNARLLNSRLPNSLRFKVRRSADNMLRGLIFHMPCRPPSSFNPNTPALVDVWQRVHALLDELHLPIADRQYAGIADAHRKAGLRPMLDTLSLTRTDR